MDAGARSRTRHSVQRQLLVVARSEEHSAEAGREIRIAATEDAGARAGVDSHVAEGASRKRKSAHQLIRVNAESGDAAESSGARDLHPARATAGPGRHRCQPVTIA